MITLVPLSLSHAAVLSRASADASFLAGLRYTKRLSRLSAYVDVLNQLYRQYKKRMIVRSIMKDGHIVGRIGVWKSSEWQLFFWVIPSAQRQGVATQALQEFLDMCPQKLIAFVRPWNVASQELLKQAGFHQQETNADFLRYEFKRHD